MGKEVSVRTTQISLHFKAIKYWIPKGIFVFHLFLQWIFIESIGEGHLNGIKETNNIGRNYLSPIFPLVVRDDLKNTKKSLNKETASTVKRRSLRIASPATNAEIIAALKRATRNILFNNILESLTRKKTNKDTIKLDNLMVGLRPYY